MNQNSKPRFRLGDLRRVNQADQPVPGEGLYTGGDGPFEIAARSDIVLRDRQRGKDLPLRVVYPLAPGPFPLITWSHGAFGSKDGYRPLTDFWAAHGYVCLQPTHSDSVSLGTTFMDWTALRDWRSRPADVSFLLDNLDQVWAQVNGLRNRTSPDCIGVGGHSFGAHTAQLINGVTAVTDPNAPATRESFSDPRPAAFLMISPPGLGGTLDARSWEPVTRPLAVITGTRDDSVRTGQPYIYRLDAYERPPAADKYLIVIADGYHGFGGISGKLWNGAGPVNQRHVDLVRTLSLAFWNAYLKDRQAARQYLTPATVAVKLNAEIEFSTTRQA